MGDVSRETFGAFVDMGGNVIRPRSAEAAAQLRDLKFPEADQHQIDRDDLKKKFDGPLAAVATAVSQGAQAVLPGLKGVATLPLALGGLAAGAVGWQGAADAAEQGILAIEEGDAAMKAANPTAAMVGTGAGLLGSLFLGGGAAAKGIQSLKGAATTGQMAAELGVGAVKAGVSGALIGGAVTADQRMLEYISTPEGGEKAYSEMLGGIVSGAEWGLFGFGAAKAVGGVMTFSRKAAAAASQGLSEKAMSVEMKAMMAPDALAQMELKGQTPQVKDFILREGLNKVEPSKWPKELDRIYKRANDFFKQVRSGVGGELRKGEVRALKNDLYFHLGSGTPQSAEKQLYAIIEKRAPEGSTLSVRQLHNMRIEMDKVAGFRADEALAASQGLTRQQEMFMNARTAIDNEIARLLKRNGDPHMASLWQQASRDSHMAKTVSSALQKADEAGNVLSGWAATAGGAAGYAVGGPVGAAVGAGIAGGVARVGPARAAAKSMRAIAMGLDLANTKSVDFVQNLLTSKGAVTAVPKVATLAKDYQAAAQSVQVMAEQPQKAVEEFARRLEEQGVPGQVVDAVLPHHERAMAYLATQLPGRPFAGMTVAPTQYTPPIAAQRRFMDAVNVTLNPHSAFQNPTPQRMLTVQAVYPHMVQQMQDVLREAMQQRVGLSPEQKRRAGAILGMAGGPMDTPQAKQALAMVIGAHKAKKMALAQGAGGSAAPSGRVGGLSGMVSQTISRSDRMSR